MKEKDLYVAPECDEIVIAPGGVIATSGLESTDFTDGGDLDELFV